MRRLKGGRHNFHVCAATAQVELKLVANLLFGGMWLTVEQGLQGHDHAVDAITALCGLLVNEGLLNGGGLVGRAQTFQRSDLMACDPFNGYDARACGDAVNQHSTGSAFAQATAKFGTVQLEVVAQYIKQRRVWLDLDRMGLTVDVEGECLGPAIHALVLFKYT